ncbi:unnamed protein product [Sphagnum troendelagicum]|uniref:GOLD domain-containing protein n=1 Tax=Sphagnum troendelagicum TaxID=128251 RepID=A0ABP0TJC0_9BRYO
MASTAGLVPITRAFLSKFYDKYPFQPLTSDVSLLTNACKEQALCILAANPDDTGNLHVTAQLNFVPPHKIDENTWRNREQVEEILFLLQKDNWPSMLKEQDSLSAVAVRLAKLEEEMQLLLITIQEFQKASSERIFNMVLTYMPQDFRSVLFKQQRERSEKRRQAEVDALLAAGGSIHDKYLLLWRQQMDRRHQLAQLGSSTGVLRTIVKWLVGVPQVLLDFVCRINDDNGPMEEQRQRYGPPLYELTSFSIALRVFVSLWWSSFDHPISPTEELLELMEKSVNVYSSELKRFLSFMREVFENSPFLISAEDAGIANNTNDFLEAIIVAGRTHEVPVVVECEGSLVAWDFRLTAGKDVGFSVEFEDSSSTKRPMLPYHRYEAHQGNFCSPSIGTYKLIWDNTYSNFYRKIVRYKVDSIPPVLETNSGALSSTDESPNSDATSYDE